MTDILQQFMNGIENTRTLTSVSGLSMIGFAALFIFGVLNCILGYRLLRFWMMLFGFAIGAGLGIGAAYSMNVTEKYIYAAAAIGTGVVIAVIAFLSYKIGIFILGMGIGLGLGIYFFRPTTSMVFFVCLLLGVGFGVFAMRQAREILIIGTSLLGGIMAGLSLSKLGGLPDIPYGFGMSAGFVIFGMLIQFLTNKKRTVKYEEESDDDMEDPEDSSDFVDPREYIPERNSRKRKSARPYENHEKKMEREDRDDKSERKERRREKSKGMVYAPELEREKTVVYRLGKKSGPDMPLGGFKNTGRAYEQREQYDSMEDYQEEPIDEELLDEEVLREMMDDDDREGEELWKKLTGRKTGTSRKNQKSYKK